MFTRLEFSFRELRYFVVAAKHASITDAAKELNISASSISVAIAHIERVTGRQLFVRRHARGLVLTDEGVEFAQEARNILSQLDDLQAPATRDPRSLVARIDLGCLLSLAPFVLPPLLTGLRMSHPRLDIRIHEGGIEELLGGLSSGKIDAALTYDTDLPSAISCLSVQDLAPHVLLNAGHRLAGEASVSLSALIKEPFVLVDYAHTRDYLWSVFAECGVALPRVSQRVRSYELMRNLVASGFGYSVVNISPAFGRDPSLPVVARPVAESVRVPRLVIARMQRARINRVQADFVAASQAIIGELPLMHSVP